jgi:putative thioredoxin
VGHVAPSYVGVARVRNNGRMSMPQFSRPGAFDLSALASPKPAPGGGGGRGGGAGGAYTVEITSPDAIAEVAEASMQHVVVLSLWSPRSPQSVQVNDALRALADAYEGRFMLAAVDVDTVPQVAQAVGAQGVPFVVALLRGQPVAQVPPSADEAALRQVLDQLVQAAVTNGITGRMAPRAGSAPEVDEDADDPRFAEADAAYAAGDLDAAVAAYQRLVQANPADAEARERLAGVSLMRRTQHADLAAARAAAAERPDDVDAQLLAADLDVVGGHVDDAFGRLIDTVRRTRDEDRDRVRTHLLELFEVVGADDPRVATARRNLAMALF